MSRNYIVPGIQLLSFWSISAAILSALVPQHSPHAVAAAGAEASAKVRPVVALERPTSDDLGGLLGLLMDGGAGDTAASTYFAQGFQPQRYAEAEMPPVQRAPAAAPEAERTPLVGDPNFKRWQKDADQKLKEEDTVENGSPHKLAEAYPGKAVVVCEAGCRSGKDEVVYVAALVPAEVKYEPSSSNGGNTGKNNIPCIAGCYGSDEQSLRPTAAVDRRAEGTAPAATETSTSHLQPSAATLGVILPAEQAAPVARHSLRKLMPRVQVAHNGAIVDRRRSGYRIKSAEHRADRKAAVVHKESAAKSWRPKVTFAGASAAMRTRRAQHAPQPAASHWTTEVHIFID